MSIVFVVPLVVHVVFNICVVFIAYLFIYLSFGYNMSVCLTVL